ncbi:ATP-binding cassette domain-containing protein [Methanolobus sp. WCC5]|uniref:ATP-binding cassette domain-containing protein n=1 Tax=Methanolobus sp. WCC5 TaxID=3125785 RepID=UPI0032518454
MSIEVKNLSFCYNRGTSLEKHAIDNISFSIGKGEFVLIGGEVGSGKSTLARHLNGLLRPQSGSVTIDGKAAGSRKVRSKAGLLMQYPQKQLFGRTVYEDVAFAPSNFGFKGKELDEHVMYALGLAGLDGSVASLSPFSLSGGQMRLVALAGVLSMKPDYLILDEPASGLDPDNRVLLIGTLEKLHRSGISIVVISHQLSELLSLAEKIIILKSGRIEFVGSVPEYLRSAPFTLPEITSLMKELNLAGINVGDDIYSVDDAFSEIIRFFGSPEARLDE